MIRFERNNTGDTYLFETMNSTPPSSPSANNHKRPHPDPKNNRRKRNVRSYIEHIFKKLGYELFLNERNGHCGSLSTGYFYHRDRRYFFKFAENQLIESEIEANQIMKGLDMNDMEYIPYDKTLTKVLNEENLRKNSRFLVFPYVDMKPDNDFIRWNDFLQIAELLKTKGIYLDTSREEPNYGIRNNSMVIFDLSTKDSCFF